MQVRALLGGGGDGKKGPLGGLGDMGNIMENMKKAQSMVQTEAARIQEELAAYAALPNQTAPNHAVSCETLPCCNTTVVALCDLL